MRSVSRGAWRYAAALTTVVVLAAPAAWGDVVANPTDPPQSRLQPPVGLAAEVRLQPPVGVAAQARLQPPGGVTAQVRIQPPVGITPQHRIQPPVGGTATDQTYFEQLMLWLRTQLGSPIR